MTFDLEDASFHYWIVKRVTGDTEPIVPPGKSKYTPSAVRGGSVNGPQLMLGLVVENSLLLAVEPASKGGEEEYLRGDGPFYGPGTVSEAWVW